MRFFVALLPALLLGASPIAARAQVVIGKTTFSLPDITSLDRGEREILRIEQSRSAAIAARDMAKLGDIYAHDFRGVTPVGARVNRDALFSGLGVDDPSTTFAIDELTPRLLTGTSALLTGRMRTFRERKQVAETRFMHVYVRHGRQWEIAAEQATPVTGR